MTKSESTSEIHEAEQRLKARAEEFEQTLNRLTQKIQEGTEYIRKLREDTSNFVENIREPGVTIQPYLEKGIQMTEEVLQKYLHEKRSAFENYVTQAAQSLEHGTDRFLEKLNSNLKNRIQKIEARPLIPAVTLFLGGVIVGGFIFRQAQSRRAGEPTPFPTLRRVEGMKPETPPPSEPLSG